MTTPAPEAALTPPVPTQVKQPWRTTVRSVFQGIIAFAVIVPFIIDATGLKAEDIPWLAGVLAVLAAIVRVMALPQVENFLRQFVPFLAAQPTEKVGGRRRVERGAIETRTIAWVGVILGAVALFFIFFVPRMY